MAALVLDGEITFFSETKGDKITFVANKREVVKIGSNLLCDVRITGADDVHMTIEMDPVGKVRATNLSANDPISVNGETVTDKRFLKSGDVITIKNHSLRWDLKAELRRRTAALTKSARKEAKHRVIRTTKRLTIHNLLTERQAPTEIPAESIEEDESETVAETPPPKDKENLSKLSSLNLSGTLITSFTPQKATTRSSSVAGTASPKNILNESSNLNRSMHLVDLTGTPLVKRNRTPANSAAKRTPLSVKKTPVVQTRNETLLKSAIKNSSIKKRINDKPQTPATAKAKVLFQSPIMDTSAASSSVMSVSFSSANQTSNESVIKVDETQIAESKSVEESSNKSQDGSLSDEETKKLLDDISIVLDDENDVSRTPPPKKSPMLIESERTPEIEKNFEEILKDTTIRTEDQVDQAFKLISATPVQEKKEEEGDTKKKAESLLSWIENTRETLATNNTEQVLSSRYSDVTPNDSVVTTIAYDTKTPKMSILDTVQDLRKSEGLAMSPVARLSINDNTSTVVVENFQLNNNIQKSLRSTRKRIGKAMSSLHDISQNQNSTFDETLNFSTLVSNNEVNEQSAMETTSNNILSLDEPQQAPTSTTVEEVERDENAENIPPAMTSNNYIDFAEHNENDDTEREFFEISNSEVAEDDLQEVQESSSSSEESESEAESVSDIEEIIGSSQEPEAQTPQQITKNAAVKFRLSEQDLEEEGINPLDISSRSNNEEVEIPGTEQFEDQEGEKVANESDEGMEFPATQQIDDIPIPTEVTSQQPQEEPSQVEEESEVEEILDSQEISSQQMNELMNNSGSVSLLDRHTEEVESIIEEHLDPSRDVSQNSQNAEVDITMIEEHLEASNSDIQSSQQQVETTVDATESQQVQLSADTITQKETEPNLDEDDEFIPSSQEYFSAGVEQVSSGSTLKENPSNDSIYNEASSEMLQQPAESDGDVKETTSIQTISDDTNEAENNEQQEISLISDEEIEQEQALPVVENPIVEEPKEDVQNESIELFNTQAEDFVIPTGEGEVQEQSETSKMDVVEEISELATQEPAQESREEPIEENVEQPEKSIEEVAEEIVGDILGSACEMIAESTQLPTEIVSPQKSPEKVSEDDLEKLEEEIVEENGDSMPSTQVPVEATSVQKSPEKMSEDDLEEAQESTEKEIVEENDDSMPSTQAPVEDNLEEAQKSPEKSEGDEIVDEDSMPSTHAQIEEKVSEEIGDKDNKMEVVSAPSSPQKIDEAVEESPKSNAVLQTIEDESISLKISVTVEESPKAVEADKLPENIEKEEEGDEKVDENIGEEIEGIEKPEDIPEDTKSEETPSDSLPAEELPQESENGDEEMEEREPVVEEVCVQKFAYVTTDKDAEVQIESTVAETLSEAPEKSVEEPIIEQQNVETIESKLPEEPTESTPEVVESAPEKQEEVAEPSTVETLEPPTPRRRARVNYVELAAGSPAKTPSRRGRSASTETAGSNAQATPKPPRSARKIMATIEEKTSTEEPKDETEVEAPKEKSPEKGKTPKKRGAKTHIEVPTLPIRRGHSASIDQQPQQPTEPQVSPAKSEISESSSKRPASRRRVVSESVDAEKEQPPKKRARARNVESTEEPETHDAPKARGKRAVKEEKVEEPQFEVVFKKGRGRKHDDASENSETPSVEETTRGRGRKVAKETLPVEKPEETPKEPTPVKKGRGRKKAEEEKFEEPVVVEEPKKARGRHAAKEVVEEEEKVEEPVAEEPKKARGRHAVKEVVEEEEKVEEPVAEEPKKARGRHAVKEVVEEKKESPQKEAAPVKKGRGRKKVDEAPVDVKAEEVSIEESPKKEVEPVKKGRGRKKAEETPSEAKSEDTSVEEKHEVIKKGRGRKKVEETPVEPEETVEEEKPEEVKKGRGRKKVEEEPAPVEVKSKRGARHKSPEVVEEKPARGRKAQAKVAEETETTKRGKTTRHKSPEPEPEPSTSKRGRGRKAVESSPQKEEKVESPKAKPSRRGKAAEVQKEEPTTTKRRRGAEKVEEEVIELSSQEEESKRAKTDDDTKKRKQVTFKTPSKEKAAAKTSTRKRQAQPEPATTSEEPAAKRSTRMKKK